ncbi:hypothetical protein ACVW00_002779 [Marmoricola sp. URHA0025 HA25]
MGAAVAPAPVNAVAAPHGRYRCYGLTIDSEIPLPDLGPAAAPGTAPDVTVRRVSLGDPPASATLLPLGLWRDAADIGLVVPGTGSILVRDGREILVDATADADPATVRLFVLGTAMGALMMQRGNLVLHGNAFRVGDACAVVVGRSGAGKSTLAAELMRRGHDVLSDDVVPVDAVGNALPGYPRIKLWDDAVARLGLDSAGLDRVTTSVEKFQLPISRPCTEPLPLRWVYVLERHEHPELVVTPVGGAEVFSLLHEHTYRNELLAGDEVLREHLTQCARLAAGTRISRVTRPAATMTAEATADAVLSDIMGRSDAAGTTRESA